MEYDTRLKNAIDFLMWSYFNLTLEDEDNIDRILNTCIRKAYSDATQQGAYNALIPKEAGDLKKLSSGAEKEAGKLLQEEIKRLCRCEEAEFDSWHAGVCDKIKEKYAEINSTELGELFSYGNAQKWVNMALKYIYTLNWLYQAFCSDCKFCDQYGEMVELFAEKFHVPIDSFMIEAYGGKGVPAWSKWTYIDYTRFRKDHSETLDWEGPEWIKIAKKRKKKDFKKLEKRYREN